MIYDCFIVMLFHFMRSEIEQKHCNDKSARIDWSEWEKKHAHTQAQANVDIGRFICSWKQRDSLMRLYLTE